MPPVFLSSLRHGQINFPFPDSIFVWPTRRMKPPPTSNPYKRHRFPAEIISRCAWLYCRFCLSYRDVEELMGERGIIRAPPGVARDGA
jgi:hypothetical protein